MKYLLLIFFISVLFFFTNVKDANAYCDTPILVSVSSTLAIPVGLDSGCGYGVVYYFTLPFTTNAGYTYYTLPTIPQLYYLYSRSLM